MTDSYSIIIGSIGDDSHSIGMSLLEIVFREAGFFVKNLGILNVLENFFNQAEYFDAIIISCMNGHASLYVEDFPYRLKKFNLKNKTPKVWCLGGNLSVQDTPESIIKKYRSMGFDFVLPEPTFCDSILERLYKEFHKKDIKKKRVNHLPDSANSLLPSLDNVNDNPMTDREFLSKRKTVLASWITGKEVWNADFAKNHSCKTKNFHYVHSKFKNHNCRPLIQPRTGVAHTSDEIDILRFLRKNGLDISSIQLDAASRKNMYTKAREGVERSEKGKPSFLNGYPVPVHGVKGIEEIMQAIDTPFQIRAGSSDHRLVYEIGLAGGASSVEGGFICYLFPYDKTTSPIESLRLWKYVDKLADWYYKNFNIIINREYFGPLTCTLIEPSIPICINIIQAILSAKAGVKSISVGLAEQGNRVQDIAAIKILRKMTRFYLMKYGFYNCEISTVYHHYMAAFPSNINKSRELILNSSITGALAHATRIMTKTPIESFCIPSKVDNSEGLMLTYEGILKSKDININRSLINKESKLLEKEVGIIMKSIENSGNGSIAKGAIKAFENGILDIPFSPNVFNKGSLITARDCDGAVRFINPEQIYSEKEIIDFHKEKIYQRMKRERVSRFSKLIEEDLLRIWKNEYVKWPLDGHYVY